MKLPIFILAGYDVENKFLRKRLFELKIKDEPILDRLIREIKQSDCFSEIYLVGPKEIQPKKEINFFLSQGTLKDNLKIIFEFLEKNFDYNIQVAIITFDILPKSDDFKILLSQLKPFLGYDLIAGFTPLNLMRIKREPDFFKRDFNNNALPYTFVYNFFILRPNHLNKKIIYFLTELLRPARRKRITCWTRFFLILCRTIFLLLKYPTLIPFLIPKIIKMFFIFKKYLKKELTFIELEKFVSSIFVKKEFRKEKNCHLEVINIPSFAHDIDSEEDFEILKEI
ncbi:MAG: hypothetical protein N2259_01040 [Patescibacteria group bacterium]|nr:hypothetical protein [Patescibacteria group bacterium]